MTFLGKYSFGNILAQYESWVQNVSDTAPMLECKDQQKFMSDYQFETDREENAPQTLGDGGHLEEVIMKLTLFWVMSPIRSRSNILALCSQSFTWYKTAMLVNKGRIGTRETRAIHHLNCSPVWQFWSIWTTCCQRCNISRFCAES